MRFDLNLATRVYVDRRKLNAALAGATFFLIVLLFVAVKVVFSAAGEFDRVNRENADIEKRISGTTGRVSDKDLKGLLEQVKAVNGIIDRKTLNWVGLLDRLEAVLPEGVSVVSLEPDMAKQDLKISLVARDFPLLRRSLEGFEGSKFFSDVFLLSQSETRFSDNRKAVAFVINCRLDYRKL